MTLRKKKRQQIYVRVEISNYQELGDSCPRKMGIRFFEDTLVSEAIHIIATKGTVNIPAEDEGNYGLYNEKTILDFGRSLRSFDFNDGVRSNIDFSVLTYLPF